MNKFWQLIVESRNFSHQMSIKEYGEDKAGSDYKLRFLGFTSGYVLTLYFILYQVILYFYDGPILPTDGTDSWLVKLLAAIAIIYLPMKLINYFLLKKVEHVALPKKVNQVKYRKRLVLYWVTFLLGHILWVTVGIFLMSYLRGQPIHLR